MDVKTPAEALRAISVQRDGFLADCDAGNYAAILIDKDNTEMCRRIGPENANDQWADEELWIMPVASGEIMAPMVVAAFATVGIAVGEVAAMMIAGLLNIAISMAFTAVANMLTSKKRNHRTATGTAGQQAVLYCRWRRQLDRGRPSASDFGRRRAGRRLHHPVVRLLGGGHSCLSLKGTPVRA